MAKKTGTIWVTWNDQFGEYWLWGRKPKWSIAEEKWIRAGLPISENMASVLCTAIAKNFGLPDMVEDELFEFELEVTV